MKLMTQNIALDAVPPPTTGDMANAVVVKNFETAVEEESPDH